MTISYPDVSNHNGGMPLQAGTVACFAKASEGTGYADPFYTHFKAEAARVGAVFGAYHFLRQGNGAGQARYCFGIVGRDVPLMLDFEPEYDAAGNPVSRPTLADAVAFRDAYRALGGSIRLNYLPKWYWQELGSPSLAPLADLGLVASEYIGYSDSGPGWAPYGGLTPAVWQYTDKLAYSGQQVDFNAFRGTLDQFRSLLGLTTNPGVDMAALESDDPNFLAAIWRLKAAVDLDPAVQGGPTKGEKNALAALLGAIAADVAALKAQSATELADLTTISAEVGQIQAPEVTQDALNAAVKAALLDPAVLKAIAHAGAVELHNDTPAS